jgi:hypothetical protein
LLVLRQGQIVSGLEEPVDTIPKLRELEEIDDEKGLSRLADLRVGRRGDRPDEAGTGVDHGRRGLKAPEAVAMGRTAYGVRSAAS